MAGLTTAVRPAADRPLVSDDRAPTPAQTASEHANWRRVVPFVALTFALTWLLDLGLLMSGGYGQPGTLVALQLQMLIPAASAILLGLYSSRFGSSQVRESKGRARAFFYVYLAFVLVYVAIAGVGLIAPSLAPTMTLVGSVLSISSVIALVAIRLAGGRESFARAGMAFGRIRHWLLFGLALVLFYALESALNYAFGLGSVPDVASLAAQSGLSAESLLVVGAVGVIVDSLLGIVVFFGEEYGWRAFLQGELVRVGRVRGVFAVGLIWGMWHAPIIAMGHNYPGYPVVGIVLMAAYCVLLAFVLGYAVLKTGSVWLAAFLHGLNNGVTTFLASTIYTPNDSVYQFIAGGLYGLALLAVVVVVLLCDPVWKATSADSGHQRVTGEVEL